MTQVNYPRNLYEYAQSCDNKTKLYQKIKEKCGVSMMTAERWCRFFYEARRPHHLAALSELTGIPESNLFKKFTDED